MEANRGPAHEAGGRLRMTARDWSDPNSYNLPMQARVPSSEVWGILKSSTEKRLGMRTEDEEPLCTAQVNGQLSQALAAGAENGQGAPLLLTFSMVASSDTSYTIHTTFA